LTLTPQPGWHLVDVIVDGQSRGRTNQVVFANVQQDHSVEAVFGHRLIVQSAHGTPSPTAGVYYVAAPVTLSLAGSPETVGTTQRVCAGWVTSGALVGSGSGATAGPFSLTGDTVFAWQWRTNWWLDTTATRGGRVTPAAGWFAAGSVVTGQAQADLYYAFAGWSGSVTGETNTVTLVQSLTAPGTWRAHFTAPEATNGVPLAWLANCGLTNGAADANALTDSDGDGVANWLEFYAGTDPLASASRFAIVGAGRVGASNYVTWLGGTNGSGAPFVVETSPVLGADWAVQGGPPVRAADGTNTFWWTDAGTGGFSRVQVDLP